MPDAYPEDISTPRLTLKLPQASDAEAMFRSYAGDPAVTRHLVWAAHRTADDSLAYIRYCQAQRAARRQLHYFLEPADSNGIAGMVSAELDGHIATLGYVLARSHWGRGLMTEAASALIQALFKRPHIHRVEATCDVENLASAAVLQKCGLRLEGLLRRFAVHPQCSPAPRDCFIFAVIKD